MANKQYKLTLSLSDGSKIDAGTILVPQGDRGETGSKGATFTPSVSEAGVLSWTNNGGLTNPTPVNIKGPKGDDAVITSADVAGWGFTKNKGTVTSVAVKMNGATKGTVTSSGTIDLGTVITSHQDISGKANLTGDNTFTGTQTLNDPSSGGYSINAAGYIKGSWLQAPSTGKASSNTGKVCVLDGSGWVYYRTPAEIVSDGGGATADQIPTVNNGKLTIQKNGTDVATFTANQSTNVTANITVPTKVSEITNDSGFTTNKGTVTSVAVKMNGTTKGTVTSSGTIDLGTVLTSHQDISGKLDKTTYEVNKTIEFGSSGVLYIGKFKVYDTNVTCEVTSTTNVTYSGKLVIATQNNVIQQMTVYGDAANTVAPNFFIKPSTTSDPYIEIYFKPASWSKNVVHIYGSAISAEPTNVCTSVSAVPSTATLKPTNALNSKANLNGGNTFTGPQLINKATLHISGDSSFDNQYFLDIYDSAGAGDDLFSVYKTGTDAARVMIGNGVAEVELNVCESAGTAGQVLTSQGAGRTPTWTTPPQFTLSGTTLTITV